MGRGMRAFRGEGRGRLNLYWWDQKMMDTDHRFLMSRGVRSIPDWQRFYLLFQCSLDGNPRHMWLDPYFPYTEEQASKLRNKKTNKQKKKNRNRQTNRIATLNKDWRVFGGVSAFSNRQDWVVAACRAPCPAQAQTKTDPLGASFQGSLLHVVIFRDPTQAPSFSWVQHRCAPLT